jgi:hypothetical protein
MSLQDVSNDQAMIGWLRQSGHAHLLDEQHHNSNTMSPQPSTGSPPNYPPPTTAPSNYPPQATAPSNYPPPTTSLSSPPPPFGGSYNSSNPLLNMFNPTSNYNPGIGSPSPPIIPPTTNFGGSSFGQPSSPLNFTASPTQFLAPNMNQQQLDIDIEVK